MKGFSFLSLIMVIMVVGIGLSALIVNVKPDIETSQTAKTLKKLENIKNGIDVYRTHHGGSPPNLSSGLDVLVNQGSESGCTVDVDTSSATYKQFLNWCGPYLDRILLENSDDFKTDEWGTLIEYDSVRIRSCGPNRICSDADDLFLDL